MSDFDFNTFGELYTARARGRGGKSMTYRRFDKAAEAVRYSIEVLAPAALLGTVLEVGGDRYRYKQIRALYDSTSYPLQRKAPAAQV